MSLSTHAQPKPQGAPVSGSAPQVVVRAGKYCFCCACGTLVEILADVIGLLVKQGVALPPLDAEEKETTIENELSEELPEPECPRPVLVKQASGPPTTGKPHSPSNASPNGDPPTPRPPRSPGRQRPHGAGETIDGLPVPSAGQLDRALKWVAFHLKVLQRQGSELKRLQSLRKNRVPCTRPRGQACSGAEEDSRADSDSPLERHVQEDFGVTPSSMKPKGREPP